MEKKDKTLPEQLERIALLEHVYDLRAQLTINCSDKATVWQEKRHYIYLWYYIFLKSTIHCLHVNFWICYIYLVFVPVCFQHSKYFANVGIALPFSKGNKKNLSRICNVFTPPVMHCYIDDNIHQKVSRMVFLLENRLHTGGYVIKQLFDILIKM